MHRRLVVGLALVALCLGACTRSHVSTSSYQNPGSGAGPSESQKPEEHEAPPIPQPPSPPNPPPTEDPVGLRVFCETRDSQSPWLMTLPAEASEKFIPVSLQIKTGLGTDLSIESHWPLHSDGHLTEGLVLGYHGDSFGPRSLYRVTTDLFDRRGVAEMVKPLPILSFAEQAALTRFGLRADWLAVDETHSLAVAPNEKYNYDLIDLASFTTLVTLQASAHDWINPVLSDLGAFLVMTQRQSQMARIQLWDFSNSTEIVFPTTPDKHQLNAKFVGHRFLIWLEKNETTTELLAYDLVAGKGKKVWSSGASVRALLSVGVGESDQVFLVEEQIGTLAPVLPGETNSSFFLKSGKLHVLTFQPNDFSLLSEESFNLPASFSMIPLKFQRSLFESMEYSPWTQTLVMGKGNSGGLVRFHVKDKSFHQFGYPDHSLRCLRPRLLHEILTEGGLHE